jgi:hypothetical protein
MVSVSPPTIPRRSLTHDVAVLKKRSIPDSNHAEYKKWLRYYLDFCGKYPLPDSKSERVKLFINKLREKKQTPEQQKHAAHVVLLFFEIQTKKEISPSPRMAPPTASSPNPSPRQPQRLWEDVIPGTSYLIISFCYMHEFAET